MRRVSYRLLRRLIALVPPLSLLCYVCSLSDTTKCSDAPLPSSKTWKVDLDGTAPRVTWRAGWRDNRRSSCAPTSHTGSTASIGSSMPASCCTESSHIPTGSSLGSKRSRPALRSRTRSSRRPFEPTWLACPAIPQANTQMEARHSRRESGNVVGCMARKGMLWDRRRGHYRRPGGW